MTLNWGNAICRRNIANSTEACEKRQKRANAIPPITFIEIDESVNFVPNPLIIKIVHENFLQTTSAVYAVILGKFFWDFWLTYCGSYPHH